MDPINAKIVLLSGPLKGKTCELGEGEFSIGREPSNSLCLPDDLISRRHAIIRSGSTTFSIVDLGSRNGTIVNLVPIQERTLESGDRIQIGDSVLLFLSDTSDATAAEPVRFDLTETLGRSVVQLQNDESLYLNPLKKPVATDRVAGDLKALLQISTEINSLRGQAALQRRLLELTFGVVPAETGAIVLLDPDSHEPHSKLGWSRLAGSSTSVVVSRIVVNHVVQKRTALLSHDRHSVLVAPLILLEKVMGVIYLETSSPQSSFDEGHLQFVLAVAGMASAALENARRVEWLEGENRRLKSDFNLEHSMVGESPRIREIYQFVAKVAPADSTVLIRGESGTGKELVARAIHSNSSRAEKAFVAINCAALTETLLESELFGHEKGAFTGAIAQKRGKLETAEGGTVFLDEVGELASGLQAKLLRVLQERQFERVGGTSSINVDIRLIAATNKNLEAAIQEGSFRQDLYYRLNVLAVKMPPLRERREDIPLLARYFTIRSSKNSVRPVKGISMEACTCLVDYDWPGNVRELENAIERAVVLGTTELIVPEDLPEVVLEKKSIPGVQITEYHQAVKETKRQLVLKAFEDAGGSYAKAARILGMHPNNLHRLIRNLDLKLPPPK
jgi:transcriptional regulator with GAF, ATPase, and Fis domain